ncbi:hypothetical protein [Microbulbifer sp. GL-2]|uniref:hypothetical protein n=1 Tax=Microbulbifer sp. GL-2 TaxID=2591606 RepID=UPI00117D9E05|nr:hypothetical protein [Microbulbifer sp. GL-2]
MNRVIVASISVFLSACTTTYQEAVKSLLQTDWIESNIAFVPTWENQSKIERNADADLAQCLDVLSGRQESQSFHRQSLKISTNTKKLMILDCMAKSGWRLVPNEIVVTR